MGIIYKIIYYTHITSSNINPKTIGTKLDLNTYGKVQKLLIFISTPAKARGLCCVVSFAKHFLILKLILFIELRINLGKDRGAKSPLPELGKGGKSPLPDLIETREDDDKPWDTRSKTESEFSERYILNIFVGKVS